MQQFNANQHQPQQGFGGHPPGMFPFTISNTYGKQNKDGNGYHFVVELKSDAGTIENRYNLWNASPQAVEIANKELSALCHAVGIFLINFPTNQDGTPNLPMFGAELRGGRGRMEVAPQKNNPDYMEVKRVFDANGNEPGKPPMQGQQQQVQQQQPNQPMTQQAGGGWGNPPSQQPPNQQPSQGQQNSTWNNPAPNNAGTGAAPNKPPWS